MPRALNRAAFVRSAGAAFAAATLLGRPLRAAAETARALVPVEVTLDRVTRTTVGLRPYRASGFVLRAEGHDAKTIIHDYGHGGGGMSLSWGTALLAAELALQTEKRRAAVVGCGVIGLSTARVLQDAGFDVTIYARDVPPDTTSNMSGAQWTPTSVFDDDRVDEAFRVQYVRAAELAYRRYQTLLGDDYGVRWIENYDCRDDAGGSFLDSPARRLLSQLYPEVHTFGPGEHPFPTRYATRLLTMLIEPNRYLRAVQRDYLRRGGRIVGRTFASLRDLLALDEPLVMNCTGLGAKTLVGDDQLEPVRGQLSVLAPQPAVDYVTLHVDRYMFPRSDGIVLGGTFQHGDSRLAVDDATVRTIVADHAAFFAAMHAAPARRRTL
ncbi:MAG TPA: FAD-dependent oxidoreductase [Candidatus Elarobacter sp.]|jgi:glycine/D-amino acid oxidase-like deaminating enzyme|nr:FAD-dependent oxidoreductase [Candidatus Elarobacter sp.]